MLSDCLAMCLHFSIPLYQFKYNKSLAVPHNFPINIEIRFICRLKSPAMYLSQKHLSNSSNLSFHWYIMQRQFCMITRTFLIIIILSLIILFVSLSRITHLRIMLIAPDMMPLLYASIGNRKISAFLRLYLISDKNIVYLQ